MNELEAQIVTMIEMLDQSRQVSKECIAYMLGNSKEASAKQSVVNKLNGTNAISNSNLRQWCKNHGIKIHVFLTLETCLRKGRFSYKQRRGNRTYYVKNGMDLPLITTEDIV